MFKLGKNKRLCYLALVTACFWLPSAQAALQGQIMQQTADLRSFAAADTLLLANNSLSPQDAARKVKLRYPTCKILSVQSTKQNGQLHYRVKILIPQGGRIKVVTVNAKNGRVK